MKTVQWDARGAACAGLVPRSCGALPRPSSAWQTLRATVSESCGGARWSSSATAGAVLAC
eukprot:6623880-Prymnesium_polylepis.1